MFILSSVYKEHYVATDRHSVQSTVETVEISAESTSECVRWRISSWTSPWFLLEILPQFLVKKKKKKT